MALDFPSSPADGDVYGNYTYNTAKGAWIVTPTSSRVATTSDTPPANPTNGDMWMYTVDGTCFIYYEDGTSGQWVEQSRNTISASTYQSPNFLINGGFDIWQRGTSSTTNTVYLADRWVHLRSAGTHTVSRSTDVPNATLQYSLSFASTSGTTPLIRQYVEAINALALVGQTVTLSIWAKSTVGTGALNWTTAIPTVTDTYGTVVNDHTGVFAATMTVGTWTRYSATFTVGAGAVRGYLVQVFRDVATTSTTTLYAGAQLEIGTAATSFRRNAPSIQAELAACQRYYYRSPVNSYATSFGQAFGTTLIGCMVFYPVVMRATPVADFPAASNFQASTAGGGSTGNGSTITLAQTSVASGQVQLGFASAQGLTAGHATILLLGAGGYLGFSAEL